MANVFTPFGFRQTMGTGSAPTYEQVVAVVASNADAIYFGDVVTRVAAGSVEAIAADTDPIAGIFVGCKYLSTSQKRTVWSNYWPGTDTAYPVEAYIVNDPNAKFSVQSSGGSGVTLAMSGQNVAFDLGTGNAANGISGAFIDVTTLDTTATLPFRIVGIDYSMPPGSNGSSAGVYNYAIVAFNNVETKSLTGAV